MIRRLTVHGYRSIAKLDTRLAGLTVVCGPNGVGKTNLYNALRLLVAAARGQLRQTISREGGMPSALWAGYPPLNPRRIELRVEFDDFGYQLSLGLPSKTDTTRDDPRHSMFTLDPMVKEERIWAGSRLARAATLFERTYSNAFARDDNGRMVQFGGALDSGQSALSQISDPRQYAELWVLRDRIGGWRLYHHFDTGPHSPNRTPQTATQTPVLADGGEDLAAALRTIIEIGDRDALADVLERAFPENALEILDTGECRLLLYMARPGIDRKFAAGELSDGTLRFLCLTAALLTPRPAAFLALNEPETSIHPDLTPALADLIARAATKSQVWVTTHSTLLAESLVQHGAHVIHLQSCEGRTEIVGAKAFDGISE